MNEAYRSTDALIIYQPACLPSVYAAVRPKLFNDVLYLSVVVIMAATLRPACCEFWTHK